MFENIPLHMNVMVVYFTILPFVLFYVVKFARKKEYKKHFVGQLTLLVITVCVLIYFEIMIRVDGGFFEFAKHSSLPQDLLLKFLFFHIFIALIAAILWVSLFVRTYNKYKLGQIELIKTNFHKRWGILTASFITLSCVTGVFVYLFLFIV